MKWDNGDWERHLLWNRGWVACLRSDWTALSGLVSDCSESGMWMRLTNYWLRLAVKLSFSPLRLFFSFLD